MTDDFDTARQRGPETPRWVKLSLVIAAIVVVAIAILLLVGDGGHGPARHFAPSSEPSTTVTAP